MPNDPNDRTFPGQVSVPTEPQPVKLPEPRRPTRFVRDPVSHEAREAGSRGYLEGGGGFGSRAYHRNEKEKTMTIYDSLAKDHDEVTHLLDDLIALDDDDSETRNRLVREVRDALIPHARAEESVFYNAIRALDTEKSAIMHGYNEHVAAETLLRTLQVEAKAGIGWRGTAKKLRDALAHHIQEEETEFFSIGRRLFTESEAEMIGAAFERLKPEIREEGIMGTTMDMIANLMPPRMKGSLSRFISDRR